MNTKQLATIILGCLLGVLVAGFLGIRIAFSRRQASEDLELLLHGSASLSILKMQIAGYYAGSPVQVTLTNRSDLDFLSSAFRQSTTNNMGSFVSFTSRVWFSDGNAIDILLLLPNDASCMVVSRDEWSIRDPIQFRIPLKRPLPLGLAGSIEFLLTGKPLTKP